MVYCLITVVLYGIASIAFRYECGFDFSCKWLGLCRWLRFSVFTGGIALLIVLI